MKKVSIGFVGLSAAASSALVQSVVDQLAPEGTVMIDRDENGADITVWDEGERFLLPDAKLTVENGVATIESGLIGDLRFDFDEISKFEKKMTAATDLPDLDFLMARECSTSSIYLKLSEAQRVRLREFGENARRAFSDLGAAFVKHNDNGLYKPPAIGEAWAIELSGDRFVFNRLIDGRVNESYRPMETDEALLAAVSVIQGFQPPRSLCRLDTPAG